MRLPMQKQTILRKIKEVNGLRGGVVTVRRTINRAD